MKVSLRHKKVIAKSQFYAGIVLKNQVFQVSKNLIPNIVLILLLTSGCATTSHQMVNVAALPERDEMKANFTEQTLADGGYHFMWLNFKFDDNFENLNKLNRIGARITKYTERPNLKYRYFIIDTKYKNVFAMPGGYVYITSSLMETVNDEQLASILAHEIAHVTHKHGLKKFESFQKQSWLKSFLGKKVFFHSTDLRRDLDNELQADITGARYLKRAGYDPAITVETLKLVGRIEAENNKEFERDVEMEPERRKLIKKMIRDHPPMEERVQKVKEQLEIINREEKVLYSEKDFVF